MSPAFCVFRSVRRAFWSAMHDLIKLAFGKLTGNEVQKRFLSNILRRYYEPNDAGVKKKMQTRGENSAVALRKLARIGNFRTFAKSRLAIRGCCQTPSVPRRHRWEPCSVTSRHL